MPTLLLALLAHGADDFHTAATTYPQNALENFEAQACHAPLNERQLSTALGQEPSLGSPHLAFRRGQLAATRAAAATWLMEWRARQWVAKVNHAKGCAPSTEQE